MGSSKTTETTQAATAQPNTPIYAQEPVQNYYSGIDNYANADPQSFVTPMNDIQRSAFDNTQGLFGTGDVYGQAAGIAAKSASNPMVAQSAAYTESAPTERAGVQTASAASMLDNFNSYLDPTLGALVDTTLADFDANSARTKAAQRARYAGAGAFGGSRAAIGEGLLDSELARARASTDAGLRSDAWRTAAGFSQYDATNRQGNSQFNAGQSNETSRSNSAMANQRAIAEMQAQNELAQFNTAQTNQMTLAERDSQLRAAQALAAIGGSAADTYRADLGAQMDAGNTLYSLENAQTQAPLTQLQALAGLLNPGLVSAVSGQTTTGSGTEYAKTSGGLLNGLMAGASLIPGIGSGIKTIGKIF